VGSPLAQSFVRLAVTNILTKGCWALTLVLITRSLGASALGQLAALWAISGMATGVVDLGSNQTLLRDGSRFPGEAVVLAKRSFRLQVAVTLALIPVLVLIGWPLASTSGVQPAYRWLFVALGIATPLIDRFQSLFTVYSQLGGRYGAYSWMRSLYFVVLLAAIAFALSAGASTLDVAIIYFLATAIFVPATGVLTWRLLPASEPSHVIPGIRRLLQEGAPFLLVTLLTMAYGRMEVALLAASGQPTLAGAYHLIYQVVLLAYSISGMLFTVTYPRLYGHKGSNQELASDFNDTTYWLTAMSLVIAPPLLLFGPDLLQFVGADQLAANANMLRALSFMILLLPATAALNFLLPMDRMRTRILCDALGIAGTLLLAQWAIRAGEPWMVSIAAVAGYALACALAMVHVSRSLHGVIRRAMGTLVSMALRALIALTVAVVLPAPWWIRMCVYLAAFAALLFSDAQFRRRIHGLRGALRPLVERAR